VLYTDLVEERLPRRITDLLPDWMVSRNGNPSLFGNPTTIHHGCLMIKPHIGDIGRRVIYRVRDTGREKQGVLLNMEPANDPTQVKVLYDDEWETTWVACDELDWVNRLDRLGERPPDQSNDRDKG
jgi:hypothetical protein